MTVTPERLVGGDDVEHVLNLVTRHFPTERNTHHLTAGARSGSARPVDILVLVTGEMFPPCEGRNELTRYHPAGEKVRNLQILTPHGIRTRAVNVHHPTIEEDIPQGNAQGTAYAIERIIFPEGNNLVIPEGFTPGVTLSSLTVPGTENSGISIDD